jgi:hypothetical protein
VARLITSIPILIGYSIVAVPTGIHAAELANNLLRPADGRCATHGMSARA